MRANRDKIEVAVLYHGGEPLLNKRFPQMVKEIKALEIPLVKTVSNGMLLNERTIVDIVESRLDLIEFSLDGQSPSENDFIRRDCDYYTVVSNIKNLIAYKRQCKSETPQIFIASTQFISRHAYQCEEKEPEAPKYLVQEFSGDYLEGIAGFKNTYAIRWPQMQVLEEIYELYEDPCDRQSHNFCDHVENTLTVRWNGDIVPCCYDLTSQYVLGNIHQADLATIWNNTKYLRLRRSIHEMNFIPPCDSCGVVKRKQFLIPREECLEVFR
jgi:radical SAM protein with 4Fe4S-binding SPASM domain